MFKLFSRSAESHAMLLILNAILIGSVMDICIKLTGDALATWQLLFLRWFVNIIVLLPFALHVGWRTLAWHNPRVHFMRVVLVGLGSYMLFYSLAHLPLAMTISLFFTEPLFMLPLAALLLKEKISPLNWLAALAGFAGVLLIARPADAISWESAAVPFLALLGALGFATCQVMTKGYGKHETTFSLIFWLSVLTALFTAPMAYSEWKPMTPQLWLLIFAIAGSGCLYNYLWISALRVGSMASIANLSYLNLPLAYLFGWLIFDEIPDLMTVVGSLVILASVIFIGRHNIRQARKAKLVESGAQAVAGTVAAKAEPC